MNGIAIAPNIDKKAVKTANTNSCMIGESPRYVTQNKKPLRRLRQSGLRYEITPMPNL